MIRKLHRWPGLLVAVLLLVSALSGAALSLYPAIEAFRAPSVETGLSVAMLASRVQAEYPGIEQIRRAPSGQITAWWFEGGQPGSAVIDPSTGKGIGSADPDPLQRWLTNLHRSLLLGDGGRLTAAAGALAMLLLALSGAMLIARRTGGWGNWFSALRGPLAGRLHTEIARFVVFGLVLTAVSALWMTAETFEIVSIEPANLGTPREVSGQTGMPLSSISILSQTPVTSLRNLSFPAPGDATDVFTLESDQGIGYIDQGTGTLLDWADRSGWERVSETIYMLHSGQGAPELGLILGLMALGVPVLGETGALVWLSGRRGRPRLSGNSPAGAAETIVLVGSEGGTTWGFAATLLTALREAGQSVHVGSMAGFDPPRYGKARRFIVLAATYGEGDVPATARGFLDRLQRLPTAPAGALAVLGFGDRSFAAYCGFAEAVQQTAVAKGWSALLPFDTVDRQSPQDFARWGHSLGRALGIELELSHQPVPPATVRLTLISRRDHGSEVQAPTTILRFALPDMSLMQRMSGQGLSRFCAGDLLGVLPETSAVPRLYSLASGAKDGFVEIVVKKHPGGLCSGQLTALQPGQSIQAFLRRNPGFHAGHGRTPLLLIGAGTGIGPLAGFIRANARRRPIQLYFGMRREDSDFYYRDELRAWLVGGQLSRLITSVSRGARPQYVQDALRGESAAVATAITHGARVMVCGGRNMARDVRAALTDILRPCGLTPAMLKAEGRYVEDVY
jgi:sulfite reductase (NADPH) flavoprotein alpha-component